MDGRRAPAHSAALRRAWGAGFATPHHPALTQVEPRAERVDPGWDVNFLGDRTRVKYVSLFEQLADYSQPRQLQSTSSGVYHLKWNGADLRASS